MPTYEMLWDCGSCGTRKLLGKTHRRCPNCGAAQDARKRYFPPEGEEVAVEGHVYVGVDWTCAACQTPNSRAADFCVNCGSPREGNADVRLVEATPSAPSATPDPTVALDPPAVPEFRFAAETREIEEKQAASAPRSRWWRIGGIGAAIVTAFMSVTAFWTRDVGVVVERHEWVREIDVERMAARPDSAWCDSMPGDAYNVSRSREQRSTREVADGQECSNVRSDNGDGTFSTSRECSTKYRSEPVYDDRCRYTVNRWGFERTAKNSGSGLFPEPTWPATHIRVGVGGSCMGCEKEGARRETLTAALRSRSDRSKTWRCDIDAQRWRMLGDGQWTDIKVRVVTGGAVCDTLKP